MTLGALNVMNIMSIAGKSITLDVQKIDITLNTRNTTLAPMT